MAFVTFYLEKDARKALSATVSDGQGTVFSVSYPKEKQQASSAPYVGDHEELKLYVRGIPSFTTETEVLAEFTQDGNCTVHMMENTAFVNFGDKKNAARAIKRLHNQFSFPGSSRCIIVRYARKTSHNTPSAKKQPTKKPSKVPLY
jgi:RNA recognition motif-containing protein